MELQAEARSIVLSAAGTHVAVLDREGVVRVWPLRLADMLAQACARMRYGMSLVDWERFHGREAYRPTCPGLEPAPPPGG